jgi:glycosyltransferase involved in cell wall biosynthesis/predicted metal-dependent phosphoesterase TrpH
MTTNENAPTATRADLHCHSTASAVSKLGVSRALGLPECATPPEEVYALAKRRGMDFVTITDHDTIDGVMAIADRPDVFVSEELTARFAGEPQAVHVLCLGITPGDHEWLQAHADDVEVVAGYLREREIACALAHPFYSVAAPLTPRHRRRLAQLFDVWEVRNGARAPELNRPAAIYVDTHGGVGIGGSDDHAGVDIGRTWTQAPTATNPLEFLAHLRDGRVEAQGAQGSAAKWAHAAMAIAVRVLGGGGNGAPPDPGVVLRMVERVMADGDARSGALAADMGPDDARALLRAWLAAIDLDLPDRELLAYLQSDGFSHSDLFRRARRCHERKLQAAVARVLAAAAGGEHGDGAGTAASGGQGDWAGAAASGGHGDWAGAAASVFEACVAAIPYAPATAFQAREKDKLASRDGGPLRVALIADGIGATHGVTRALEEVRERGVPGFEVEVIGTDAHVDRRLPSVAEAEVPYYAGLKVGVPSLPAVVEALSDGRYDLLHLCTPGPAGIAAALTGRLLGLPTAGSYHTELAAYAGLRSGDAQLKLRTDLALAAFYGHCDVVLSPSSFTDDRLGALGIPAERIARWDRGVDLARFSPERREPGLLDPARINVLYAGRLTREKGVDLLADAFLEARRLRPALQLVLAGGGPEEASLRERLGDAGTFLGWLEGDALAAAYASADLFLFCSQTDTYGQVLLEAQASGLPVVAVAAGGPAELVAHGRSGLLCSPDPAVLGLTLAGLAGSPSARRRLSGGGLRAVQERSWEAALGRLAEGWQLALAGERPAAARAAA